MARPRMFEDAKVVQITMSGADHALMQRVARLERRSISAMVSVLLADHVRSAHPGLAGSPSTPGKVPAVMS